MALLRHSRSRTLAGTGAEAETDFYTQWWLSRGLFPCMRLRNTWENPPKDPGENLRDSGTADLVGFISDLDFSPNGRLLAASSTSNAVFVFDPSRGSLVRLFNKPHNDSVSKVRFVNDYQFVSGSADSVVAYWDMRFPSKALNYLQGHSKPIRYLNYLAESSTLVTASLDGDVRRWHLPTFALGKNDPLMKTAMQKDEPGSLVRGVLFKCPNLNLCQFSESMAVCANSHATLFLIDNLELKLVQEDLQNMQLNETTQIQLCWFKPNASQSKRNRVKVIEPDEYSPVTGARISNISHLSFHPHLPIALLRLTTSRRTQFSQEVKDWTCVCRMKPKQPFEGSRTMFDVSGFGANVVEDTLLFASEEAHYASFREKQPSFSLCGRVIASPDIDGVKLLQFSDNMGTCSSPVGRRKTACPMDSLFTAGYWPSGPSPLQQVAQLPGNHKSVVCCKFSPTDNVLLAAGDSHTTVSFYKPKL